MTGERCIDQKWFICIFQRPCPDICFYNEEGPERRHNVYKSLFRTFLYPTRYYIQFPIYTCTVCPRGDARSLSGIF